MKKSEIYYELDPRLKYHNRLKREQKLLDKFKHKNKTPKQSFKKEKDWYDDEETKDYSN